MRPEDTTGTSAGPASRPNPTLATKLLSNQDVILYKGRVLIINIFKICEKISADLHLKGRFCDDQRFLQGHPKIVGFRKQDTQKGLDLGNRDTQKELDIK